MLIALVGWIEGNLSRLPKRPPVVPKMPYQKRKKKVTLPEAWSPSIGLFERPIAPSQIEPGRPGFLWEFIPEGG